MAVRITRAGVGLTAGIILLALVVLGGLYFAKERGEQARREEAIQIAQENLEQESEQGGAIVPSVDGEAENENENENENQGTGSSNGGTSNNSGDEELPEGGQPPSELPATGPAETFSMVGLGLLVFAVVSYLASRRALLEAR